MAWRMLMRRIPNRWMTLVGDTAQTGDPAGAAAWQDVLGPYVARRWKLTELTVNYRTPAEIMELAHRVLAEIDPEQTVPRSVRESGFAPWARRVDAVDVVDEVRRRVHAETGPGLTAVLAGHEHVAQLADLRSDTVSVLTVKESKGLEFDTVIIVEPQDLLDESPRGINDLYVALTRATQRLGIVHARPLPRALAALDDVVVAVQP